MNSIRERGCPTLFEMPAERIDQPENYETRKWTPETIMAIEGEWYLESFVEAAIEYNENRPNDGNAERIADLLLTM